MDLGREAVTAVLDALEAELPQDENGVELIPPSAMATLCLRVLLGHVSLPPGTLHSSQEIRVWHPVPVGTRAVCEAVIASVSDRANMTAVSLDFNVDIVLEDSTDGDQIATGSTTVMFPASSE